MHEADFRASGGGSRSGMQTRATSWLRAALLASACCGAHSALRVLHVAERFAVVAKPAGTLVHRNKFSRRDHAGRREEALLQNVRDHFGRHVHPVHRLDGGTSGCLIFAFDGGAAAALSGALRTGQKEYLAFTRGDLSWIDDGHVVEREIRDDKGVRKASRTSFRCVASCEGSEERSSLVLASPSTGRWHQIRKHLAGLSHPILGDASHGDTKVNRWWREERGMAHLGLHCLSICLELPAELADPPAEQLRVRCPVRPELLRLWQTLPWWDEACAALPELAADAADAAAEAARHEAAEAQARADGEPPPGKLEASVAPRSYCFY